MGVNYPKEERAHTHEDQQHAHQRLVDHDCYVVPQKGPSWGYQRLVLGAIGSFLSTFGENRPRFLKILSKLTFEYPHERPCVADADTADDPGFEV